MEVVRKTEQKIHKHRETDREIEEVTQKSKDRKKRERDRKQLLRK
jgi:hypothetical protein